MPYKTNADLPESVRGNLPAGAQTIFRKAFNSAYKQYGSDDEARLNKVAWSAVKNVYEKEEDGTWKLKKSASAVSSVFRSEGYSAISRWIPVARVGQEVHSINGDGGEDNVFYPTAEAFEDAVDTWAGGDLTKNHEELIASNQILDAKFESPLLYLKVTQEAEEILLAEGVSGRSVELILLKTEGKLLTKFAGSGLSVLYPPKNPACTPEMGCSGTAAADSAIEETKPVYDMAVLNNKGARIKIKVVYLYLSKEEQADEDAVKKYLSRENYVFDEYFGGTIFFYKHDEKLKIGDELPAYKEIEHTVTIIVSTSEDGKVSHGIKFHSSHNTSGGDIERMGAEEENPPVTGTLTTEQVDVLIASAVATKETELNALHQKAIEEKEEELKKFKEDQIKEVEEKVKDAETRAALLEQIKQQNKPTDEVLAKLVELPTASLEVFSQLEQTLGGEQAGISSGTEASQEEGEYKGAGVGNFAATGKWE